MRIAVWNTAFLGDALLTLPLVRALRKTWPQAEIDGYLRAGLGSLFSGQPDFSDVYEVSKQDRTARGMLHLSRHVSSRRYDVWISAHTSPRSSLVAMASGAPLRIGYSRAWHRNMAYTHTVDRNFDNLEEIERLLELLRPLESIALNQLAGKAPLGWQSNSPAWPPAWSDLWPDLHLPEAARKAAAEFWKSLPPGPVLGMHPGSIWGTKRWTSQGFASVARQAVESGSVVLLFAGPGEGVIVSEVLHAARLEDHPRVRNLSEHLDLPQLAAWLKRLDCYLSNDSGPMHLAWLQRVPLVAIFGPTVRELGFFPRGARATVVENPASLPCRPCGLHGPQACPRGDHTCMTGIDPETVWEAVHRHLSNVTAPVS